MEGYGNNNHNYRGSYRGGSNRGNRGSRGNRGNRGSRGSRGNRGSGGRRGGGYGTEHKDIDYYLNVINNPNNNQNQYQNQGNYKKENKKKKNVKNIDDYFNRINEDKNQDNKKDDNYNNNRINQINDKKNNIKEYNDDENYNRFPNDQNNIYQDEKRNKKKGRKRSANKNNEENQKYEGFNKSNKEFKNVKKIFFKYTQLLDIIDKDDNEIMQFFMKFRDLPEVFNNTIFKEDMLDLMTELLARVSTINSGPSSTTLNQILVNTNFIELIKKRLEEEDYKNTKYLKFLYNVALLNNKLIDKFTDDVKRLKYSELSQYSDIVQEYIKERKIENDLELALKITDIMNEYKEKEKHKRMNKLQEKEKEKEKEKNQTNQTNNININNINSIPIDYKQKNILLSNEDFNEKINTPIAPHIKFGPYISYERYINTMFYLEYEDCYRDLRKTINTFRNMNKSINDMDKKELQKFSKAYSDVYFYLKGEIIKVDINRDGLIITVDFCSPSPRKLKFTKRMISGSLIILCDNNYENYLLTTVFYNPYVDQKLNENKRQRQLKMPKFPYYRVQLSVVNINPQSFLFIVQNRKNLQIFESKAYFESYVHVMKRLKEINIPDLPFKEELVDANFNRLTMRHVNENYNYRYNDIYLNPYQESPKQFKDLVDDSQLDAINKCLLYKIALIQGPPGTGKTHVGTILANILLQNLKPDSQILVVCYTNHALDSFIEDILKYTDDVVRIGGRCKNEKVKEKALNNKEKFSNRNYKGIVNDLEQIGEDMKNITSLIDIRRRVDLKDVKRYFQGLFKKVIDDFCELANQAIPKNWKVDLKKYIDKKVFDQIYIFWNKIDCKSTPSEIILTILDKIRISENGRDFLYQQI